MTCAGRSNRLALTCTGTRDWRCTLNVHWLRLRSKISTSELHWCALVRDFTGSKFLDERDRQQNGNRTICLCDLLRRDWTTTDMFFNVTSPYSVNTTSRFDDLIYRVGFFFFVWREYEVSELKPGTRSRLFLYSSFNESRNPAVLIINWKRLPLLHKVYMHPDFAFIRSARPLLTKPVFVLQVLEHVGRVSSVAGHFMEAQLADGASVHVNCTVRILQVSEIFPDGGADALGGRVKVGGSASCIHSQLWSSNGVLEKKINKRDSFELCKHCNHDNTRSSASYLA